VLRGSVGVLLAALIGYGCMGSIGLDVDRASESTVGRNQSVSTVPSDDCVADAYSCGPLHREAAERADAADSGFVSGTFSFVKQAPATQPPVPDFPLATFAGMNDYLLGGQHHDAEYVGRLRVDGPCVYGIDIADDQSNPPSLDASGRPLLLFLSLPSAGTRQDPVSGAIWVWGYGPMTNGDLVIGGGGYTNSVQTECPLATGGQFYASTLRPKQE